MSQSAQSAIDAFMNDLVERNPGEPEFHQAVHEFINTVMPFAQGKPEYAQNAILERMTEPDRIITFRVCWEDDNGLVRTNRAWRVQFNNSIGPYKGGTRFHPTVTQSVLKFLGFEQVFKNALTTLPMGGAKGGSNFNPKGKSDREIMRFCHSLMTEMHRHIGENTDVPAGDIGVGAREISYMFGQYRRLENVWTGTLTGKGLTYGGSLIRREATGYGCVYFAQNMLEHRGETMEGKTCTVSGSGNVAIYTIEKLLDLNAKVVTASDSGGFVYDKEGFNREKLEFLRELKEERRGRIHEYAEKFGCEYHEGARPWGIACDAAFPCATQNEISGKEAEVLLKNGVHVVSEGANMPSELDAMHQFVDQKILYAPAKAANAGGVAVSGLEQSQNSLRISWTREEVDQRLQGIMKKIHAQCVEHGESSGSIDYVQGANLAGFVKIADTMLAYGTM